MSKLQTADDFYAAGNSQFVDENYSAALAEFSTAIELDNTKVDYFLKRAATLLKLDNYQDAINDCNAALKLDPNNVTALLRKGMGFFELDNFAAAREAFESGLKVDPNHSQLKTWYKKALAELEAQGVSLTQISKQAPSNSNTTQAQPQKQNTPKIRHEWYQTPTHIVLSIFARGVNKSDADIQLDSQSVGINIKLSSSNDFALHLDLFDKIIPSESVVEYLSSKVELKLKKADAIQWDDLEGKGAPADLPKQKIDLDGNVTSHKKDPKKYPSSKGTDWDLLNKEIGKELENEKPEGDAALQALFQQIYGNGSDEQKKAMIKSFTESGGTVLSTNWDEVGKKKIDVSPPSGMEAHSWNK